MALKLLRRNFFQITKKVTLDSLAKEKYSIEEISNLSGIQINKSKVLKDIRSGKIKGEKEKGNWLISKDRELYERYDGKSWKKFDGYSYSDKTYFGYIDESDNSFKEICIEYLKIKIQNRPCSIYFSPFKSLFDVLKIQGIEPNIIFENLSDLKNLSDFSPSKSWVETLKIQEDEPRIISGELYDIDCSNIKVPHRNYYEAEDKISSKKKEIEEIFSRYGFYIYKNDLYYFDASDTHTFEEQKLLIKQHYFRQEKKFSKLKKEIKLLEKLESMEVQKSREPIPEVVRFAVWRRDKGKCVKCGSNKKIEFDHIIPVSKGGSSTERNIQILCETCNREKSDKI